MDLATPAPHVEAAEAQEAPSSDAVVIEPAQHSESVRVDKPPAVEPAVAGLKEQVIPQPATRPSAMSVGVLRGQSGADFESKAAVLRGAPKKNLLKKYLPFFLDERDFVAYGEVLRFILIKGDVCFVFADENETSPLYAISLDEVYPLMEDPKRPDKSSVTISPTPNASMSREDMVTVLFKYRKDRSQAYQFTFSTHSDKSLAKRFVDTVEQARAEHSTTGPVRASVVHAKNAGAAAAKAQPNVETWEK